MELTDVSCQLVLLKMTSLQCLDFWGRHPPPTRVINEFDSMNKYVYRNECLN